MTTNHYIGLNTRQDKKLGRSCIQEVALANYDELTRDERLSSLAEQIASATDEEEQRRLKGKLPFRCPHYTKFADDYRDRQHIVAASFTWQTCVDIDDKSQVEGAIGKARELNEAEGLWHGLLLHMDYSARRKLHIDIRLPLGMTVAEAQRAYCKALGVDPDTSCFTPERFIYITPASFEIYRADGWYEQLSDEEVAMRQKAYLDRGLTVDGRTADGRYFDPEDGKAEPEKEEVRAGAHEESLQLSADGDYPAEFKGIKYNDIIAEYWKQQGGEPTVGERNDKLFELAANLRAICDNQEQWLMAVMPSYGISRTELKGIVHSACKEPTKGSKKMDAIVAKLSRKHAEEKTAGEEQKTREKTAGALPALRPNRLPIGLKESLAGVPQTMQMPVLCAVMPIAGAYADGVEVQYCDGNSQALGLMALIYGEQASGKSVCKNAIDIWKRQMDEEDAAARQIEEEWKAKRKCRKASEKAPDDPHVLIRNVPVTISCSTLLRRLKNAQGHTLYSFCEELDTLRKSNGAGSWSAKYDIYRLGFDHGEWGQDFNSDEAESGVAKVAYNWTILGTFGAVAKCYKQDNVENGLSGRTLPSQMPDTSFSKMPKYKKRTEEEVARIQEAVTKLKSYSGYIDTPRLRRAIEQWVEEKRIEAAKDFDKVKDVYRKRAAVIGFRCGVIHHLLSASPVKTDDGRCIADKRESKATLLFALMMAQYCMDEQIKAFGPTLQKQYILAEEEGQRATANHCIFDQLEPVFTMDDLRKLKQGFCNDSSLRTIIYRWTKEGWIKKVDATHWEKVEIVTVRQ